MFRRKGKKDTKRGKSPVRKVIDWLHLWLGLASGIIVLIIAVTGCLYVFQKEINEWYYKDTMFVQPAATPVLPLTTLTSRAQEALGPDMPISGTTAFTDPDRAWEFYTYKGNDTAITYFGAIEYYKMVYVNPYTGVVTGVIDFKHNFFAIVKYIHWSLLLNTPYGQPIVGWSTFIFVILLITGLVLWWPKKWSKATRDQSFKVKWKAGFKRLNYDLHNVLGFYALAIALVLALTGMVWAFSWFEATVYVVASRSVTPPAASAAVSDTTLKSSAVPKALDISFAAARKLLPGARRFYVYGGGGGTAPNTIGAYYGKEVYYGNDELKFDQYSGKLLERNNFKNKNAGEKLIRMNYDIHVGAIGGIPGKIIAFIVSLICASLPVTGFYVWWNKKKKTKKKIVLTNHSKPITSL
ncbi:PepSY domain-containing protein [Chitinophaga sp. Cy-1792]|uniref:PepSY-associated TM helix domain-containing protein n=1 Tax=Chitinophaga sp. Cy-1792 TaxID=2608339 RepID=UPI0014240472|nr:PepSY-associated TM helix domain-containing protein [Chitinophaga sp. Cy-1792]NIG57395.1 PepSY domain-containing protein [Chitinophaga sp. Cy-1792]